MEAGVTEGVTEDIPILLSHLHTFSNKDHAPVCLEARTKIAG
jgi:hypothetical protein